MNKSTLSTLGSVGLIASFIGMAIKTLVSMEKAKVEKAETEAYISSEVDRQLKLREQNDEV